MTAQRTSAAPERWTLLATLALLFTAACEAAPVDALPETVVREFVERMRRVHGDPVAAHAAYDLLWREGKTNLIERAKRATAVMGRTVAPADMLAPSRFSLNFRPKSYRARVQGKWAIVTVTGEVAGQLREIKSTREADGWRVALELPPLSPIQKRASHMSP